MSKTGIAINRSPQAVWDFLVEPTNWKNWWGASLVKVDPGWHAGATLTWENGQTSTLSKVVEEEEIRLYELLMETILRLKSIHDKNTLLELEFNPKGGAFFSDGGRAQLATTDAKLAKLRDCIEGKKEVKISGKSLAEPSRVSKKKCWFCFKNPSSPASNLDIKIHKSLGIESSGPNILSGQLAIRYQNSTVTIPRCEECRKVHAAQSSDLATEGVKSFFIGLVAIGSGVVAGILAGKVIPDDKTALNVLIGIVLGIAMGFGTAKLIYRRAIKADPSMKKKEEYVNYQPYKRMLKIGWREGEKPRL